MRPYRGLTKDGKLVYGGLLLPINSNRCFIITGHLEGGVPVIKQAEVLPETVDQSTGICDKNGKEIFEGDIVKGFKNHRRVPRNGVVTWSKKALAYIVGANPYALKLSGLYQAEIISNIHDKEKP